jgi:hypothetical protein
VEARIVQTNVLYSIQGPCFIDNESSAEPSLESSHYGRHGAAPYLVATHHEADRISPVPFTPVKPGCLEGFHFSVKKICFAK